MEGRDGERGSRCVEVLCAWCFQLSDDNHVPSEHSIPVRRIWRAPCEEKGARVRGEVVEGQWRPSWS